MSRALLEHINSIPGNEDMRRVLKPGGQAIHLVPCRYSLLARLPGRSTGPSLTLLHTLNPDTKERSSFRRLRPLLSSALRQVFREAGFREVDLTICWGQPGYFEFFLPVFLLTSLYERFVERRVVEDAASYVIVHAWAWTANAGESIPRCRTSDRGRSGPWIRPVEAAP